MTAEMTHTAYEGLQGRIADMDALLALVGAQDTDDLTAEQAERLNGLGLSDYTDADLSDVAYSLADSYCYGAHTLYRREDDDWQGGFKVSRVELLLAGGGPTHVMTWDERGQGWSDYFDSWAQPKNPDNYTGDPTRIQLSEEEWETVRDFLAAFIVGDLN